MRNASPPMPGRRLLVLAVAALTGCAPIALADTSGADPSGPAATVEEQPSALSAELFYRLLVADVAAQRGEAALAAREFLSVARQTQDAKIAERATEMALAAREYPTAIQAANLWIKLDPSSERALRILTALQASAGSLADVREHLGRMVTDEKAGGTNRAEVFMQLPRMLSGQQDKAAVFRLLVELAQPYQDLPEANYAIAATALAAGLPDGEIGERGAAAIDRALVLRPGWDRAAVLKAQMLAKGSPEKAISWLRGFSQAHPDARSVRTAFAQYLVDQRRYADARAEFQRLWDEDRTALEMRYAIAVVSLQMRDYATAEGHLQALKQAGYGDPGAVQFALAQAAEEARRYEEALSRYREVDEGDRQWQAKLRIAAVLGKLGRIDEARAHLRDLTPDGRQQKAQVAQAEASLLRDANRNDEAYAVLSDALAQTPEDQDLMYDLALVAEKLDRIGEAEQRLRRLLELAPESAHALNALGYTLVDRTDRLSEGIELIQKALKLMPNDPFILDSMGWAYYRLGNLEESERALRHALEQRPDPEIAAHLGEVLWARGRREEANAVWQTQLKDTPDHPVLLETIRRLRR